MPAEITDDYANYPNFPVNCEAVDIHGSTFVVHGVTYLSLGDIPTLSAGDSVTWNWTDTQDCNLVTFSEKGTTNPWFDQNENQPFIDGESQVLSVPVDGTPGHLTFEIIPTASCNLQIDANVGPALSVVGPSGSYYSNALRVAHGKKAGPDALVSAWNGHLSVCDIPTTTSIPVVTSTTSGAMVTSTTQETTTTVDTSTSIPVSTSTSGSVGTSISIPEVTVQTSEGVYYNNCAEVGHPLGAMEPGYRAELDSDHDGTACDSASSSVTLVNVPRQELADTGFNPGVAMLGMTVLLAGVVIRFRKHFGH